MASLAVKYRPKTFEDVCGQNVIVTILNEMTRANNIPSAMGFFGASGCGKTTIARIVANTMNNGNGHPIEIDAASNNSVDDVRRIIENSKQRSLDSEYKFYIIDECHGISSQGWQAFLKLLEEPNKYTKFIFCTTNPEKIPDTVISRIQTFNFTKLPDNLIVDRLKYICDTESLILSEDSLSYITRISNGSMRQAITNLEKCISETKSPDYQQIVNILGSTNFDNFISLYKSIYNKNIKDAIMCVEQVYKDGKDIKLFTYEFIKFMLDLCKIKIFNDFSITNLPNISDITNLFEYSEKFELILEYMVSFYETYKQQSDLRFLFEANIIKWCR